MNNEPLVRSIIVRPPDREFMGLFKWLERKSFTGEVLKDYGDFRDANVGIGRFRTSIMLCRRRGRLSLVVRTIGTSPLSASAQYMYLDVTPETLSKLEGVLSDAKRSLEAERQA